MEGVCLDKSGTDASSEFLVNCSLPTSFNGLKYPLRRHTKPGGNKPSLKTRKSKRWQYVGWERLEISECRATSLACARWTGSRPAKPGVVVGSCSWSQQRRRSSLIFRHDELLADSLHGAEHCLFPPVGAVCSHCAQMSRRNENKEGKMGSPGANPHRIKTHTSWPRSICWLPAARRDCSGWDFGTALEL